MGEVLAQDEADPRSLQRETTGLTAVPKAAILNPPHPAADVFPMLDDDELEELAADIRNHGLLMPLLVGRANGQMVLVDGRNRREACRRAGITPNYTLLLDGEDLVGYILSANIHRRNLSKGQRALLTAKLSTKLTTREAGTLSGTSREYISRARAVLDHAPDLANSILAGSISLDNAYEEARIRKGRADTYESRFNALKATAPDLADMVTDGQLNLEEAEAAEREREAQASRRKKLLAGALHALSAHAYVLDRNWRAEVMQLIRNEAELYKQHNCGPVDEFIDALEVFERHAGELLEEIRPEETHESRFESLKTAASDLAERVVEGQLKLEEAEAARVVNQCTNCTLTSSNFYGACGIVGADLKSSWQGEHPPPGKAINPPLNQTDGANCVARLCRYARSQAMIDTADLL
jgi:ParB-like chromosome segregation protein Spo0J